jgi:hypothetical protein
MREKKLLPVVSSSSSQKCSFRTYSNHNSSINDNNNNNNNNNVNNNNNYNNNNISDNNNNNDNNNKNKWVCSCNRATNIFNKNDDVVQLKTENSLCALDVLNALDLMPVFDGDDENYFEKKIAFALVAGVVDYDAMQYGAFETRVVDALFPYLLFSIVTRQSWKSKKHFDKWKTLVSKPFESFQKHWLLFDSNGNFLHMFENDTVSETASEFVFVSQ